MLLDVLEHLFPRHVVFVFAFKHELIVVIVTIGGFWRGLFCSHRFGLMKHKIHSL